ncbi:hypothetical protein T492DRAFT_1061717 [Pavlovales sp. CCMP2436]|nr:hypothetical protein T492DRAFT_1061717 [Pavlovales sp. CCMP2436]
MCHARLLGGRVFTEERTRDLNRRPPANIIVEEASMLTQQQRLKMEAFARAWGARLFFLGDYCEFTSVPMQCQPVDSASMNLEGLRRYHVEGVKRTSDPLLMSIQEGLRYIIANTAGGLFFAGGYGQGQGHGHGDQGQEAPEPVDATIEAQKLTCEAVPVEQHSSVYKVCSEMADGDVILAATRFCPHCGQSAIEKCTCMTATTLEEVNFASAAKRDLYIKRHKKRQGGEDGVEGEVEGEVEGGVEGGVEKDVDLALLQATSDFGGALGGEVTWKCTKAIRGTVLVNGARFRSDKLAPTFAGVDLTQHIGSGITFSPTSTIHSYQGITFEGDKLYLDFNMIWDVRMLYVAVSRVRCLEQLAIVKSAKEPRYMGEGVDHRTEKARQFGLARAAGHGAIEEYPVGDGRYIADLAVFDTVGGVGGVGGNRKLIKVVEVVVTSPPSREKLEYYEELGIECVVINILRAPPRFNATPDSDEGEE